VPCSRSSQHRPSSCPFVVKADLFLGEAFLFELRLSNLATRVTFLKNSIAVEAVLRFFLAGFGLLAAVSEPAATAPTPHDRSPPSLSAVPFISFGTVEEH
jgi:hypothetical protein